MSNTKVIQTPKIYYITRRIDGHGDWQSAFWRELFQNSVDAGAKRIDIDLETEVGRGSFGRTASIQDVLRVRFRDDGHGMTQETLENVFFRPGETTKHDATTTGGFGTARLMLCFSQVRYSIQTGDWVVEGDGGEYTCMTRSQAIAVRQAELDAAVGQRQYGALKASLEDLMSNRTIKGCIFEIDIDPKEPRSYPQPNRRQMTETLESYLSMSQLPCKVYLGGEEMTQKTLRGPARRMLVATFDGQEVPFATAHVSTSEKAPNRGKILIRSNGALMHVRSNYSDSNSQIIIEIDPTRARSVLNENRDSVRHPYLSVIEKFQADLLIDNRSALREEANRRHVLIRGEKGLLKIQKPSYHNEIDNRAAQHALDGESEAASALGQKSYSRLPPSINRDIEEAMALRILADVFKRRGDGLPTFLDEYENQFHVTACALIFEDQRLDDLRRYSDFIKFAIGRIKAAGGEPVPNLRPISGINDIHIQTNDPPEKIRKILFKYYPHNWRPAGDKPAQGVYAHSLLAAWNVSVGHAANALFTLLPDKAISLPLMLGTGFYFTRGEGIRIGDKYVDFRPGAVHAAVGKMHLLLINPVYGDGTAAFDLGLQLSEAPDWNEDFDKKRAKQGLQKIAALAIHEVGHIIESRHNEAFASILTELQGSARFDIMMDDMRIAIDKTKKLYLKPESPTPASSTRPSGPSRQLGMGF